MTTHQQYRRGMSEYHAGRYTAAVALLEPLADGTGPMALLSRFYLGQAHYRRAVELLERREFGPATRHFEAAAKANPHGGGFGRYLAACHSTTRGYDLAAGEYEKRLQRAPDDAEVRIRLALTQWQHRRPLEAQQTLRAGLARRPDHPELHYQLGVMLAGADEFAEAEREFERTIALAPAHAEACERLAQCCSLHGRHERALGYLERAHQLDPAHARIAWQLSLLAGADAEVLLQPAVAHVRTGAPALQEADLDRLGRAVVAEPDFVEALLALPASGVDQEVFSTLAATLERALQKHPEYADLHYHCGEVYRRLGRRGEALRHAEQAVQLNPRYVNALILLARLYGQTEQWLAGVERLEQAIAAGGDYPDVHFLLGRLCQTAGQTARARRAYQRALQLKDDYEEAREALAGLPLTRDATSSLWDAERPPRVKGLPA